MCEFAGCPVCEGTTCFDENDTCQCYDGWIFNDQFGEIITREQYNALPEDDRGRDNCPVCNPARLVGGLWVFNN
jgi:hypothetical protein